LGLCDIIGIGQVEPFDPEVLEAKGLRLLAKEASPVVTLEPSR
jgi:hypothetical protein